MGYKKSKYIVTVRNGEEFRFFNGKNLKILEGDIEDYEYLNKGFFEPDSEELDKYKMFYDDEFLIDEKIIEELEVLKKRTIRFQAAKKIASHQISYMRISLTENCNLCCKYCFVNDIFQKKGNMKLEDFVNAMNWFINQNKNNEVLVQYFGGEPLLRMDLIKVGHMMLEKAKKTNRIQDFKEEIVTNGTLLTEELAEYFNDSGIDIVISLDGNKAINDKNRIYRSGKGSFEDVLKGINNWKNKSGNLSLLITPTKDNIDCFSNIVNYFIHDLGANSIGINTPQPRENGWDISGKALAKAIQDAWELCKKNDIEFTSPANNIVFLTNNGILQTYTCLNTTYGTNKNSWGVYFTSDNKISRCVVECNEKCTKKFEEFSLDQQFIDWHFNLELDDQCMNCPLINICGGPCSIEATIAKTKNHQKCIFFREMIQWCLQQ